MSSHTACRHGPNPVQADWTRVQDRGASAWTAVLGSAVITSPVTILGLDNEGLTAAATGTRRNAALYDALERRPELHVGETITPRLPAWFERLNQALHPAPSRDLWRERAGLSPLRWRAVTAAAERLLREREGSFDVVLQFYAVHSPGRPDAGRPYALYLDSTLALTRRHHPRAAPLLPLARRSFQALERETYRHAAALLPMSDWVRRSLIDDYGCDPARIVVAGAGTNSLVPTLEAKRWDRPIALFAGLDWTRKGGPQLLEAWPQVRRAVPGAELWIAGLPAPQGPAGDGVRWLGRLDRAALADVYAQATVFALPSLFDPFPHVVREALGHGVACVCARVGAVDEIVAEGTDALLVPPGDAGALAGALIAVLGDAGRAEAMGRAGHERITREVTWDDVAARMAAPLAAAAAR